MPRTPNADWIEYLIPAAIVFAAVGRALVRLFTPKKEGTAAEPRRMPPSQRKSVATVDPQPTMARPLPPRPRVQHQPRPPRPTPPQPPSARPSSARRSSTIPEPLREILGPLEEVLGELLPEMAGAPPGQKSGQQPAGRTVRPDPRRRPATGKAAPAPATGRHEPPKGDDTGISGLPGDQLTSSLRGHRVTAFHSPLEQQKEQSTARATEWWRHPTTATLRRAVLLSEILRPPLALRPPTDV